MSDKDNFLFSKCLDYTRALLDYDRKFTFRVSTGLGFNFCFNNFESGHPETKFVKKKKTPSQLRRDQKRIETFRETKKAKVAGPSEAEAHYELMIDAHPNCTVDDITEAITTNYFGILGLDKAKEGNENLRYIKIHKIAQKQVIVKSETGEEYKSLQVFKVVTKDIEEARNTIESWNEDHNFDDLAFKNYVYDSIKVKVKEVARIQ